MPKRMVSNRRQVGGCSSPAPRLRGAKLAASWSSVALSALLTLTVTPRVALGQTSQEPSSGANSSVYAKLRSVRRSHEVFIDEGSGTSLGIEGYAGLSVLTASGSRRGHLVAGGLLRTRVKRFEFGGTFEQSDYSDGKWRSVGGYLGYFLPYVNWVDVDSSVGFAYRRYENHDRRYGSHGAVASVPSLTFRVGISERSAHSIFALRLGAALFTQVDLTRKDVSWSYEIDGTVFGAGTTAFGGTTIGLMMNLGFDFAFRSAPRE